MAATPSLKGMPQPSSVFPLDPNKPLIPVDVLLVGTKGRLLVRMALDTGATYTMAPIAALRAIGYDPAISKRRIDFIAAGSIEYRPLIKVKTVHALGVQVAPLEIVCHDLPSQSPTRGLLGLNFLKHISLCLDFPHHKLTVAQ
ncbi:MAG: retroviral-like aspartic protease family protein [Candidatus Omnitrophica bacterium]|nr:retroviral-like aspartic protease family protein [Candidatus Omnitrophota bacterium]